MGHAQAGGSSVAAQGEGYIGLTIEQRGEQRVISSIDPAGPAANSGLKVGDLFSYAQAPSPNLWSTDFLQYGQSLEDWVRAHKPGTPITLTYVRSGWLFAHSAKVVLADAGSARPPAPGRAASAAASAVETARTAYLKMCGKGSATLSAATCAAMKRDLDQQVQAQAAAAHEAEVMGVYRKLCGPGGSSLSPATCASMLAEAKRQLAASPTPPAPTPVAQAAAPSAARPQPGRADSELGSAYQELCRPGAEQVSAATCASLKADAARAGRAK